jgi:hypothetical protein
MITPTTTPIASSVAVRIGLRCSFEVALRAEYLAVDLIALRASFPFIEGIGRTSYSDQTQSVRPLASEYGYLPAPQPSAP